MAAWDDVARIALGLPETSEGTTHGNRAWKVRDKLFVWERPLRKSDLEALGEAAPEGPILGARVEHEVAKQALLADDPAVFFTTPHFDGHPSVLIRLGEIAVDELEEVIVEAWLCRAPQHAADAFLAERGGSARRGMGSGLLGRRTRAGTMLGSGSVPRGRTVLRGGMWSLRRGPGEKRLRRPPPPLGPSSRLGPGPPPPGPPSSVWSSSSSRRRKNQTSHRTSRPTSKTRNPTMKIHPSVLISRS